MNKKKYLTFLVFIPIFIISCSQAVHEMKAKSYGSKIQRDPVYLTYPKYRIDHLVGKICIIGDGENKEYFSSRLIDIFMKNISTPIRVVEPGNLESMLKGRIIEYETGLTKEESQLLSQMLQIDHVLIFNEKHSPHQDYIYGGRYYAQISLKIINTISGEIIFQTVKRWGIFYPDPRPTFSSINAEPSENGFSRCTHMVLGELLYAFGGIYIGLVPTIDSPAGSFIIREPVINSPAYKAGFIEGDKILEISGISVNSYRSCLNIIESISPKQGSTLKIKLERKGKILELDVKFPLIPMYPAQKQYKEEEKTGTDI
jgi:hypothetical protein